MAFRKMYYYLESLYGELKFDYYDPFSLDEMITFIDRQSQTCLLLEDQALLLEYETPPACFWRNRIANEVRSR